MAIFNSYVKLPEVPTTQGADSPMSNSLSEQIHNTSLQDGAPQL